MWTDPHQHEGNAEQENFEQLRQGCYGIYEERSSLEVDALYTVLSACLYGLTERVIWFNLQKQL